MSSSLVDTLAPALRKPQLRLLALLTAGSLTAVPVPKVLKKRPPSLDGTRW